MAEDTDLSDWRIVCQNSRELLTENGRTWCGTMWLRKTFNVPEEWLGADSLLQLGCLKDADETYINGVKVGDITKEALNHGLIVISAGSDVLRMVPPLIIEKQHIDEFVQKLSETIDVLTK